MVESGTSISIILFVIVNMLAMWESERQEFKPAQTSATIAQLWYNQSILIFTLKVSWSYFLFPHWGSVGEGTSVESKTQFRHPPPRMNFLESHCSERLRRIWGEPLPPSIPRRKWTLLITYFIFVSKSTHKSDELGNRDLNLLFFHSHHIYLIRSDTKFIHTVMKLIKTG